VSAAFAAAPNVNPDGTTGIVLIHDYGQGGAFSGGNLVPDDDGRLVGGVDSGQYPSIKSIYFAANRQGYFHYVLMPHAYNFNSSSSGQAELPGNDLIVSLQCFTSTNNVANTIMHELGHNLFLQHGGGTSCNWKPNYNSVMNYRFQFPGVDTSCNAIGNSGESNVLDYSRGTRIALNENSLDEAAGTCGSTPIDWNFSGNIQSGVAYDLNRTTTNGSGVSVDNTLCGAALGTLSDYDDWAHVSFLGLTEADRGLLRQVVDCDNPNLPRVVPEALRPTNER
jgi:hypothetical protein